MAGRCEYPLAVADRAHFSAGVCAAKVRVINDADAERPIYTPSRRRGSTDITVARAMPTEAGATYAFDLGYHDYAWWARLDAAGCRIVTRLKANTPLTITAELEVPQGGDIQSDRIGLLPRARLEVVSAPRAPSCPRDGSAIPLVPSV